MATEDARIVVKRNGPYIVSGPVPLRRKRPVMSEHGEPLTWKADAVIDDEATHVLCRCGASSNKPYCDQTHREIGFDGTEAAPADAYANRAKTYEGTGVTMYDDRGICQHAGFCGNAVTDVWKMSGRTDDTVVRSQLIAMIERCPSGAITYSVDGEVIEPSLPVEIAATADGPLYVSGGIPVERADGEPFETRNRVTLCRCGGSSMKPLCDGSHHEIGFSDS